MCKVYQSTEISKISESNFKEWNIYLRKLRPNLQREYAVFILQQCLATVQQHRSQFTSALPAGLFPLLQPPPQGICHRLGVSIKIDDWPLFSSSSPQGQLHGCHFCRLTWFAFSFSGFCDVLCETPQSRFLPLLMVSPMTGSISKDSICLVMEGALLAQDTSLDRAPKSLFSGQSIHYLFQDFWVAVVLHLVLLHDQHQIFTPHMCRVDAPLEHPAHHRQLQH